MRAVSVRVNEVIGVAGYVLPGTRVDVLATASPTNDPKDMTSKVVLANVQVLTAGTRMEQDQKDGKPVQVTVVTMSVTPSRPSASRSPAPKARFSWRCATRSTRPRPRRLASSPPCCLGVAKGPAPAPNSTSAKAKPGQAVIPPNSTVYVPTVEIIRGDKRENEVIR